MTSRPLRFGVVGVGGIAQMMHLPTLAERPDLFEITALADVSAETLEWVARRYGVKATTTDLRQLLSNPNVDAVLLAFVVLVVWLQFNDARGFVEKECALQGPRLSRDRG